MQRTLGWYWWRLGDKLLHVHVGRSYPLRDVWAGWLNWHQPSVMTDYGRELFLNHADLVHSRYLRQSGQWEADERELLEQLVKKGHHVLDIGANVGYFTLLLADRVGDQGHVWAFEPDSDSQQLLRRSLTANDFKSRVTLVPMAVTAKTGRTHLFLHDENKGDHRLVGDASQKTVVIKTTALDTFSALKKISVDVIKMDIQGAEWQALQGMKKLITRSPRLQLLMEYWPAGLVAAGTDLTAMHRFLDCYFLVKELRAHHQARKVSWTELAKRAAKDPEFSANLWCVRRK